MFRKEVLAVEKNHRYGKKARNWAIRSQAAKSVMTGYAEGSETKWESGIYDSLVSLKSHKI
jgi:hypothetical protein